MVEVPALSDRDAYEAARRAALSGDGAGWTFSLYPDAGEGGGSFRSARRVPSVVVPGLPAADPERSLAEAARRARTKVRRYAASHRLNRLGTLTYSGEGNFDPVLLVEHVGAFFRALRGLLGGEPFPYVWVPEWHPGGHGLHVHFGVGRYVARSLIEQAWGRGIVHIKLIGDLPVGSGALAEARKCGLYLAKYVGKQFNDAERVPGAHRYEVAQGFQPVKVQLWGRTSEEVLAQASGVKDGVTPEHVWLPDDIERGDRPPLVWAQWPG